MCLKHFAASLFPIRINGTNETYGMTSLIKLTDNFDIAFGNDPDFDRHGIVTRGIGLLNPNQYLAVAIQYVFTNRDNWNRHVAIGKTLFQVL